ncbi:unnamed protein product [Arctia plantaginis]|uniref:Uncharacterized protein n=1 Tax=Arctia plantaginis TaxID=874455 RepID=A0A8S1B3E5_ARCPL|nr:unnamed protein product [Arctia plantaginis]
MSGSRRGGGCPAGAGGGTCRGRGDDAARSAQHVLLTWHAAAPPSLRWQLSQHSPVMCPYMRLTKIYLPSEIQEEFRNNFSDIALQNLALLQMNLVTKTDFK